ncbi:MAG: histone [Promethearchaeota archaeon]
MAKRRRPFAWSPLRELMKDAGAEIVSKDAVETLLNFLELKAKALSEAALKFAKHSKRKKVSAGDMELAINLV